MSGISSGSSYTFRPVMVFIDGGYLRGIIKPANITEVDFSKLSAWLIKQTGGAVIRGEHIRTYYYDATVSPDDDADEYSKRNSDFDIINNCDHVQLRLGRLIKGRDGLRQKGVDVLLAIDMITKAYEHQYEIAVLLAGDDDFLDVVNTVKAEGRRVYGAFEAKSASKRLIDSFDKRIMLEVGDIPRHP